MADVKRVSPSSFGSFHRKSSQIKMPLLPLTGTRTEIHSAVPPCLPENPTAQHGANTPSALNAGNTSVDTKVTLFPLPSAAHLLLRFSLRSQPYETLCGCAAQFYFRLNGLYMCNYLTIHLSVCQALFSAPCGNSCHFCSCVIKWL